MTLPTDEDLARRRFATITAVRLGGIGAFLLGILTLAEVIALPGALAYVLVAAGAVGTFLAPTLLARRWSTRAQERRQGER